MRARRDQDGVQHGDGGDPEGPGDREHLIAVRAGEDAVLVLDDRHVVRIEGSGGGLGAAGLVANPGVIDDRAHLVGVDHPDHADVVTLGLQSLDKCLAERRQAALGGGIGAENSIGHRHSGLLSRWVATHVAPEMEALVDVS